MNFHFRQIEPKNDAPIERIKSEKLNPKLQVHNRGISDMINK